MNGEESTFIRRKFTNTEVLDRTLQEMASKHYQGNVSLCIRASIESHRETLEGENQFAAHQIARQLDELQRGLQELQANFTEIITEICEEETKLQSVAWGVQMSGEMPIIIEILDDSTSSLRLEDLLEQTELNPARLQEDLSRLIDRGLVVETTDSQRRYKLAGQVYASWSQEEGQ